jgi:hypothetical protein
MTQKSKNQYFEWMKSDNDLCVPVLHYEQMRSIEFTVAQMTAARLSNELLKVSCCRFG